MTSLFRWKRDDRLASEDNARLGKYGIVICSINRGDNKGSAPICTALKDSDSESRTLDAKGLGSGQRKSKQVRRVPLDAPVARRANFKILHS